MERRQGFDHVLTRDCPGLPALPALETRGDPVRTRAIVKSACANHRQIIGGYGLSSEARPALEAIAKAGNLMDLTIIAHERTPFTEGWLLDSRLDAAIAPKQILCHSATLPAALQPLDRGLRSERRTP